MKLDTEFHKLPLRVDARALRREFMALTGSNWEREENGTEWLTLLKPGADSRSAVARWPYFSQVASVLESAIGRTRLMRFPAGALRSDTDYHAHDRVAVHVPVDGPEGRLFRCGERAIGMAPGELWVVDNWLAHGTAEGAMGPALHLVIETTGSLAFWELLEQAETPFDPRRGIGMVPRTIVPTGATGRFPVEVFREEIGPWPPGEVDRLLRFLEEEIRGEVERNVRVEAWRRILRALRRRWRSAWVQCGAVSEPYVAIAREAMEQAALIPGALPLCGNGRDARRVLAGLLREAVGGEGDSSAGLV